MGVAACGGEEILIEVNLYVGVNALALITFFVYLERDASRQIDINRGFTLFSDTSCIIIRIIFRTIND